MQLDHFIITNTASAAYLAEICDASRNGCSSPSTDAPNLEHAIQPLYLAVAHECVVGEVELDAVLVRTPSNSV